MLNNDVCPVCGQKLADCPYNGDCGEMQTIYRQHQREVLADLEPGPDHCSFCNARLADPKEVWGICDDCDNEQHLARMDEEDRMEFDKLNTGRLYG